MVHQVGFGFTDIARCMISKTTKYVCSLLFSCTFDTISVLEWQLILLCWVWDTNALFPGRGSKFSVFVYRIEHFSN
jgi:hypothetical protein